MHQLPSINVKRTTDFGQYILTCTAKIYHLRRFPICIWTFVTDIEIDTQIPGRRKRQRDNSIIFWPTYFNIWSAFGIILLLLLLLRPVGYSCSGRQYMRDGGNKPSNINRALKIRFFVHNIFSYLYIMHVYFAWGR